MQPIDAAEVALSPNAMIQRGPSEVYDPPDKTRLPGTEPGPGRVCTDATTPRDDNPMEIGYPPPNGFDSTGMTTGPPVGRYDGGGFGEPAGLAKVFPGLSLGTPPDALGWWKAPGSNG